jgi:hypothetical protein
MHSGVFNAPRLFRSTEVGLADECLPAEVRHAAAGKEMRCNPPRLASQATSVVANWPPSDPVFLDICRRGSPPKVMDIGTAAASSKSTRRQNVNRITPVGFFNMAILLGKS